jgi:hypothetical protein
MLKKSSWVAVIVVIWGPSQNSARICIEYIVKYLSKVSFVHIKIQRWDNFFFLFQYKLTHIMIYKMLLKKTGGSGGKFCRGASQNPKNHKFLPSKRGNVDMKIS